MIKEVNLDENIVDRLIELSLLWEAEDSCHGYVHNSKKDLEGNRIFVYEEDEQIIAYLFGHLNKAKKSSIMEEDTSCFEIEEIYVIPERRSEGIGSKLFTYAQNLVKDEAEYITLSSATKNYQAILHFYIDELDMKFWNVRLFKKLRD